MIANKVVVPICAIFKKNLDLDYKSIKIHINYLLKKKVEIFYLAQSASELERMSRKERFNFAKFACNLIKNKAKIILQPLPTYHIDDQIAEAKDLIKLGCDGIVIKPQREKGKQDFFSTKFKLSEYDSKRHDKYFYEYMKKMNNTIATPIIFHHDEINNSKGLNVKTIKKILNLKNIIALKEHNKSLKTRKSIYKMFGKQWVCYDGFSKEDFVKSYSYGAKSKHSNFSWFDPEWDQLFLKLLKEKQFILAKKMCKIETDIKKAIILTGYAGYKELIKLKKIIKNNGYTRMPGCNLSSSQKKILKVSLKKFEQKKKSFYQTIPNFYKN